MTTLNLPDTVVPRVRFDTLRITQEEKDKRPPYVTRPNLHDGNKYRPPLNAYAALFDEEPRVMRMDEVRRGPKPAFVPFAMGRVIGDDEPQWVAPSKRPAFTIDVSHAEVVEQRVPPPAPLFDGPPGTKLLAYDDMDPYVSSTRRLRNVDGLEADRVSIGDAQVFHLGNSLCVFNEDLSSIWVLDTTALASSAGWRRYPCLGEAPPTGTLLLPSAADMTFSAVVNPEWFVLELLPGELDAKWVKCKLKGNWNSFTVLWSQVIENDSFYIRNENFHAMVTPMVKSAKRKGRGQTFINSISNAIISPHEELCAISSVRSTPIKEKLEAVEGLPGVAIERCLQHLWIFVFTPKARNYLPIRRIDVVAPLRVLMPKGLYLFSHPPPRAGGAAVAKKCLQATHRILPPVFDPNTGMPEVTLEDATKDGEVTLSISPDVVAVLGPMHDNCVIVLAKDLENYVVVELDRFAKLKRYAGINPDVKRDGTDRHAPAASASIVGTSGDSGIKEVVRHTLGSENMRLDLMEGRENGRGGLHPQRTNNSSSSSSSSSSASHRGGAYGGRVFVGGGVSSSNPSASATTSPIPLARGNTPPPPRAHSSLPGFPGEEHYYNSHAIDVPKLLWK